LSPCWQLLQGWQRSTSKREWPHFLSTPQSPKDSEKQENSASVNMWVLGCSVENISGEKEGKELWYGNCANTSTCISFIGEDCVTWSYQVARRCWEM
jgi:hypothetical protein